MAKQPATRGTDGTAANQQVESVEIDEDATLSDIPFRQFKAWIQCVIKDTIQGEVKLALDKCSKDIDAVKKDLGLEKQKVASLTTQVNELKIKVTDLEHTRKQKKLVRQI